MHRRQTAGVFAGKGFGAGLKKQNKEVSSDESRKRRLGSFDDLRQILCRPCHCGQLVLPGVIQRHQSLADGLVNGSEFRVVVEDIDLPNIALIESRLAFDQDLTD